MVERDRVWPSENEIDLSETRKALDSFEVAAPIPVDTPMAMQMDAQSGSSPINDSYEATPPTDFDG